MDALIDEFLMAVGIGMLVATLVTVCLALWWTPGAKPMSLSGNSGETSPEPLTWLYLPVAGFGAILAVSATIHLFEGYQFVSATLLAGVWSLNVISGGLVGMIILLLGVWFVVIGWPALSVVHRIGWSSEGVIGPTKFLLKYRPSARTTIAWSEVRGVGTVSNTYWYIEANDGRRIFWTRLYKGYGALVAAIRRNRPDVKLPENLGA